MATTLAQLRARTRYYIDELEDTSPVTWSNAELLQYINDSQRGLWVFLAKQDDSFGLREATASTVEGQTNYNYPTDIMGNSIRALYAYTSSTDPQIKVTRGSVEEVVEEGITNSSPPRKYCCLDGYFQVGPPPGSTTYTFRIYYNRAPTALSGDSDAMESDDDYAEYIAIGAAIKALKRIDRDTTKLEKAMAELKLEAASSNAPEDFLQVFPVGRY